MSANHEIEILLVEDNENDLAMSETGACWLRLNQFSREQRER
jgi:hypothetical protein